MNITVKLTRFPEDNGLVHESTTYRLYGDKELTNLIKEITDSDKLLLSVETDLPKGASIYVVAIRHFNIPNINYESEVFEFVNNVEDVSNMLLREKVVIERPKVYADRSEILDVNTNTFTVTTSRYRGKGDGHTHSHFLVYSGDKLLEAKLNVSDNKTSYTFDKELIAGKNKLIFKAIHCSNNIESSVGEYVLTFDRLNFEIVSQLDNIPVSNYEVVFKKIDSDKPMNIFKVNVIDKDNNLLKIYNIRENGRVINSIKLEETMFLKDEPIWLEIYCYNEVGSLSKVVRKVTPGKDTYDNHYIPDYKYRNELDSGMDYDSFINGGSFGDIVNGEVFLPVGNRVKKFAFDYDNKELIDGEFLQGVDLLNPGTKGSVIEYTRTGHLFIDTYDTDDKPTFMVYKHNPNLNSYVLKHMITREDEVENTSRNNSLLEITNGVYYYIPDDGNNQIKSYDIINNVLENVATVPVSMTDGCLLKLEDGRVLIITTDGHLTNVYDPVNNEFIDGASVVPDDFLGVNLKTIKLVNRDYLIMTSTGSDREKTMYFDRSNFKLTPLELELDSVDDSTFVQLNGPVAIMKNSIDQGGDSYTAVGLII